MKWAVLPNTRELVKVISYTMGIIIFFMIAYYVAYYNSILYHTGVELYSSIVILIVLGIYLNVLQFTKRKYVVFLIFAAGSIGILNLLHIFLQDGITIFPEGMKDFKYQIWIMQRFIESVSFFVSLLESRKKNMSRKKLYVYIGMVTFFSIIAIWNFFVFRNLLNDSRYIKIYGLLEYAIVSIHLISLILIINYRQDIERKIFIMFCITAVMFVIHELSALFLQNNLFIHVLMNSTKAIAYYIIYRLASKVRLQGPFHKLVRELKDKNKELEDKANQLEGDIIKRKQVEDLLRESEKRYRSLIMNLNEGFVFSEIILDENGKPYDCITLDGNDTFFNLIKMKKKQVIGKRALDVTPYLRNTSPNFFEVCGKVALTEEKISFEMYLEDLRTWAFISCYSPTKGYFINIMTDITERKLAEEEIKKLTRGIEQSPSAILITDTKGEIEYVNPKFTELTGYTPTDVVGTDVGILKSNFHPLSFYDELWETITKGEKWRGEVLTKKKDGSTYWAIVAISSIRNNENIITHYIAIHEDISEQKQLRQKMEENNRRLEDTLQKLKVTQAQLIQQEKLAAIGQLAAGVAHEINNPLSFVTSNFEIIQKYNERLEEVIEAYRQMKSNFLKNNMEDIDPVIQQIKDIEDNNKVDFVLEDLKELYQDVKEGFIRINTIVSNLRNFSRIDQLNDLREYDLNEGIKSTLVVAYNEYKYYARVDERLGDIPIIYANGGQINQVLLNIFINGVHAIKEKNINEMGVITIATTYDDKYVCCDIEDNGIGIEEEDMLHIFEPFFTRKKVGEGTGLGLSISYDIIVNKHKGELSVESRLGVGSRFTIKLPVEEI